MSQYRAYLLYLRRVLRHKWYVFRECCRLGIPFLGLVHDSSKLLPSEFFPYARWFYGQRIRVTIGSANGFKRGDVIRAGFPGINAQEFVVVEEGSTIELLPREARDDFDVAWLHHQKRNRHHWQYWHLYQDEDPDKVLSMPDRYRKEMLADWRGAGRAYTGADNTLEWYTGRREKMEQVLHPETREWIEQQLGLCAYEEIE